MNTTSVSANMSISENSKIEVRSKGGKSEDSFKDMIKDVSSRKTSENNNQAGDTKNDLKDTSKGVTQEDQESTQDAGSAISDLAAYIASSSGFLEPIQLVKVVRPEVNEQILTGISVDEQPNKMQTPIQQIKGDMQPIPVDVGIAEKQTKGTASLEFAAEPLTESVSVEKPQSLLKQDVAMDSIVDNPQEALEIKQGAIPKEQNTEGAFSEENQNGESNPVVVADLKPLQSSEGTDDTVVTIKVGDTSLDSSWKQVAEEIGNMIVEKVNNEIQKVSIKLNPKDLGEINVEFSVDKGKISVSLNCSNESTKALLSSNLDSLSKVVQSSLMQETNVSITHDKGAAQDTSHENFDGKGQGQYQGDSNKKKDQERADLDFAQKLRIGIENIDSMEG